MMALQRLAGARSAGHHAEPCAASRVFAPRRQYRYRGLPISAGPDRFGPKRDEHALRAAGLSTFPDIQEFKAPHVAIIVMLCP